MISTVSKAVHCWCKLNTKKMVNKLSVIEGYGCILLVYRPGSTVWVLAHAYFCIFVLIIKIFFIKFEDGEKKKKKTATKRTCPSGVNLGPLKLPS